MNIQDIYEALSSTRSTFDSTGEPKRIADTLEQFKISNHEDYLTLQELLYALICHYDFKMGGRRKSYNGVPLGGKLLKGEEVGIIYENYSGLNSHLLMILHNLISVCRGEMTL